MIVAQKFIDISRRHFSCGYCTDNCSRSGNTVAAREDAGNIFGLDTAPAHSLNNTPLHRDSLFFKFFGFNSLAYGHDHNIACETYRGFFRDHGNRSSMFHRTDDLRLYPQSSRPAVLINFNLQRRMEIQQFASFLNSAFDLFFHGGHIHPPSPISDPDTFCSQANSRPGHVHCHIAAAYDHDFFSCEIRHLVISDFPEKLYRRDHPLGFFPFNTDLSVNMRSDGNIYCIILFS